MVKVITYGTYDLLHYGHIRLLQRAKQLGDYLIVGITSDDYDKTRGKINGKQSLMERIEAVRNTGLADEIIVEEYAGQKIDDIKRMNIDIFTVGSDWVGHFDYLKDYCEVVYLDRTEGISSSDIRAGQSIRLGMVGTVPYLNRFYKESAYVDGIEITGICARILSDMEPEIRSLTCVTSDYKELLKNVDAVYIMVHPADHYQYIKEALEAGIHVLCESPIVLSVEEYRELKKLAEEKGCVLADAIRTAYSTAFNRLVVLVKSGIIGDVYSVDATCTSLRAYRSEDPTQQLNNWGSFYSWGATALLPVFRILGTDYRKKELITALHECDRMYDIFTKVNLIYDNAVASVKAGKGVKSEGELIISGTKGYVYVPAPWWKTDYFEVRFENPENNKRFFYQLDGEGIRYELLAFADEIKNKDRNKEIEDRISLEIIRIMDHFHKRTDCIELRKEY